MTDTLPPITDEDGRRRELRKYKAIATGLLILATAIYLGCRWLEAHPPVGAWVGYVRAASEAGMVGALADWFAVTALFRHPLGLPIPHTAIIRRKKDQVGEALSDFVGNNFLNPHLITEKIRTADVPLTIGRWLAKPDHAEKVSAQAGSAIAHIMRSIDPAEAEDIIRGAIMEKAAQPQWGPPLGRILATLSAEGKIEPVVDAIINWAYTKAVNSQDTIERLLEQRAPSWAPKFVNDLVGAKVYQEVVDFAAAVRRDPNHEARQALRRAIAGWAEDLQHDPDMIARVEGLKWDVLNSGPVQRAPGVLWEHVVSTVITLCEDPQSRVRIRVAQEVSRYGQRLVAEDDLRERWNHRVTEVAGYIAHNFSGEVTGIIAETVQRWDADEASRKIELMVGKDLQYIRLNGTIVGSLAGLVIYTVSQLLFS